MRSKTKTTSDSHNQGCPIFAPRCWALRWENNTSTQLRKIVILNESKDPHRRCEVLRKQDENNLRQPQSRVPHLRARCRALRWENNTSTQPRKLVILSEVEGPAPKVRGLAKQDENNLRQPQSKGAPSSRPLLGAKVGRQHPNPTTQDCHPERSRRTHTKGARSCEARRKQSQTATIKGCPSLAPDIGR